MSIQAVGAVIELRGIPPVQKLVLTLLANAHNGHTGQCNPDQKRLAEECGISERSIRDHLNWLEEEGYISRTVTQLGRGEGKRTDFELLFLHRQNLPEHSVAPEPERQCSGSSASLLRQTVAVDIDKPERTGKEPEGIVPQLIPEQPEPDIAALALETIWAKWSKQGRERIQKNKSECLKLLRKIGKEHDLREVTKAALAYARKTEPAYHQGLDTWLKNGRFMNFKPSTKPSQPAEHLSDLERAFQTLAQTGDWMGDRIGQPIHPNRPDADYPDELYAKYGLTKPGRAA